MPRQVINQKFLDNRIIVLRVCPPIMTIATKAIDVRAADLPLELVNIENIAIKIGAAMLTTNGI
jgi:hypothetical protein